MVLAPENVAGTHLRILAQISRLLKDEDFKQLFMESDSQETLWNLLSAA
jgi:PTS system nitrogen regulatory IIA component